MINERIKNQAIQLRKNGYSIKEISIKCQIAKSTASLFLRNIVISHKAKAILNEKTIEGRLKAVRSIIRKREERQILAYGVAEKLLSGIVFNDNIAFLIASLSYECEGGKSNFGVLEFTNSDPVLVKLFLHSLRKCFHLDENKFRVVMHLHSYHDEIKEKKFWSGITSIPEHKFTKTFQKKESGINKKEGYRGCVQIKYFDVSIKRTLLASKVIIAKEMGL